MYCSGGEERGTNGVTVIVDKETNKAVMGYNPANDRILTLRINTKPAPVIAVPCYAPPSTTHDEKTDRFYEQLQQTLDDILKKDITVVMGDFNAKVRHTSLAEDAMGNHGIGETNERGWKLIDFCKENNLWLSNTTSQHHPRQKYTWTSPNGLYRNQNDYIAIRRRWK